jgi:hypothetical protein
MLCEVVLLMIVFFKMAAVAMEMAKMTMVNIPTMFHEV